MAQAQESRARASDVAVPYARFPGGGCARVRARRVRLRPRPRNPRSATRASCSARRSNVSRSSRSISSMSSRPRGSLRDADIPRGRPRDSRGYAGQSRRRRQCGHDVAAEGARRCGCRGRAGRRDLGRGMRRACSRSRARRQSRSRARRTLGLSRAKRRCVARFTVERLGDGRFIGTGPFYHGGRFELGPMALLRTGRARIVVASRKQQAADAAMFRHVGVGAARCASAGAEELGAFQGGLRRSRLAHRARRRRRARTSPTPRACPSPNCRPTNVSGPGPSRGL